MGTTLTDVLKAALQKEHSQSGFALGFGWSFSDLAGFMAHDIERDTGGMWVVVYPALDYEDDPDYMSLHLTLDEAEVAAGRWAMETHADVEAGQMVFRGGHIKSHAKFLGRNCVCVPDIEYWRFGLDGIWEDA